MPSFTVTAAAQEVQLDGTGAAQAQYTVTNTSPFELTGRLIATPQSPARPEWFSIQGTSTRDFEPGAAEQVLLQISVPAGTPAGTYTVRLDAVSEATPDEDFTEGPSVSFDVRPAAPPPPPWWRRWWWLILIGVVVLLIVIGVVIWLATRGGGSSACSRQVGARKAPITTFPNVVTIIRPPVVTLPTDTTTPAPPPPPPTTTTACP